jgi:1-acyl-sn-glycerol-3-phosphate acyltransferase
VDKNPWINKLCRLATLSIMTRLRSFLGSIAFAVFETVFTILFVFYALCFFWMDPVKRYQRIMLGWPRGMLWGARVFCGIRHEVIGKENIPDASEPHIVLSKHSSTWDVCATAIEMPRPLCYVAKRELMWIPIFGWGFKLIKPISINRKAGSKSLHMMRDQGEQRLKEGFWIIIFPEGTRVPFGKRMPFKTGGAALATLLKVPVVPVAHNAGWFWPKGTFGKRAGTVTMSIGKPISPEGKTSKELMNEVEAWVMAETERLEKDLPRN